MGSDVHERADGQHQTPPTFIADRYLLGPLVGSGGTASVYQAHDCVLGQDIALKLFHPGAVGSERTRLEREMRALARLRHPGVVASYAVGAEDDQPFMVMQLVEGDTLADRLSFGALRPAVTVALGCRLADALAHVHACGVTHRDLKPANVLLGPDGALISDFGIAELMDEGKLGAEEITGSDVVIGTACYMAPEQVAGRVVGPPADVYTLGLVLLECLTGRREYPGEQLECAVARLHRSPAIPDGLPVALADLLRRMTLSDQASRPTAQEVCDALRAVPVAETLHATPMDTGPLDPGWRTVAHADQPDTVECPTLPARRRRVSSVAVASVLAVVLGGVAAAAMWPQEPDREPWRAMTDSQQEDSAPRPEEPAAPLPAPRTAVGHGNQPRSQAPESRATPPRPEPPGAQRTDRPARSEPPAPAPPPRPEYETRSRLVPEHDSAQPETGTTAPNSSTPGANLAPSGENPPESSAETEQNSPAEQGSAPSETSEPGTAETSEASTEAPVPPDSEAEQDVTSENEQESDSSPATSMSPTTQ